MKRLRQDLNYSTSAGLLVVAIITILTGVVAHLWDLNDFVYHTYAGYVMVIFALAHVWLNWGCMVGYARFRLRRKRSLPRTLPSSTGRDALAVSTVPTTMERLLSAQAARRAVISRRGFVGLLLGGLGGIAVGRGLRQQPIIPGGADLGVVYHEWSKPGLIEVLGTVANWGQQPPLYKEYPQASQINLPAPSTEGGLATEEAIRRRRSTRDYSGEPMTLQELSRLLFYVGGINAERWGHRLRAAPSSGALYPIEVYPVVHSVEGLSPGLYHYGVKHHSLAQLRIADLRDVVVRQGVMQKFLGQANVVLFFTVIFQRMRWKYQDRTYRYGLLEAGHLGQNVYLAATSMGLGACAIGAFMDDQVNTMLGVDGKEEAAIYMLAVGKV
jgi:SagB-type dehydrogenase family enzyme